MSEETQNDGTVSGLKKTVIGTLTTVIGGAGIWVSTMLFGGHSEDAQEAKTEVVAPAPAAAPVVINLTQTQENTQQQKSQGTTTIIKEKIVEKPAEKKQEESW
jgi:coenzyme F420-reducing hydrogenase alpha subunit